MKHKKENSLIKEKSPYLLQHAHNPVDWYAWSQEVFSKALSEDKPIFLSIGYSTCHWCHVMEKESFEDEEIASILNNHFISIKVDREERPDIDAIYMDVCQMLTGSGGWPLTIFMAPDQKPFFAGTYFPKETMYGRPGLKDLLKYIASLWENSRDKINESSNHITDILNQSLRITNNEDIKNEVIKDGFNALHSRYESKFGGFDRPPKFPMPPYLFFLARYYYYSNDQTSLFMLESTLEHMYRGGIYDHIGYGFARYSTDEKWLVPHFEKMIYDNALLAIVYTELYQITKKELYSKIANDILSYILRDMISNEGGFYSAEDADSEGTEGKFYVWSYDEIIKFLGKEKGISFCKQYNITEMGNFEDQNIPNLINSDNIFMDEEIRSKLFEYRNKRVHPFKDDKILTSWNSLVIAALSIAGRVFQKDDYVKASIKAVEFIYHNLFDDKGRLLARYRNGEASILGYANDYAFLIWGLIELYETTFDYEYLDKAINLNKQLINNFWDEGDGGLFLYGNDAEELISRPKEIYDGVIPSANSVSTMNWLRLTRLTGDIEYQKYVDEQFKSFSNEINDNPSSCSYMLSAYLYSAAETKEIVIVGNKEDLETKQAIDIMNSKYNPHTTIVLKNNVDNLSKLISFIDEYKRKDNKTTIYICTNNTCSEPITDISKLSQML